MCRERRARLDPRPERRPFRTLLTVVVPTFKEAENLPELARRVDEALGSIEYEMLIVDDNSPDDTMAVAAELGQRLPVRAHCRTEPPRDLSLSVVDGIRLARYDTIIVMDADLSHPPDVVPKMFTSLQDDPARFKVGSRYVEGGGFDKDWNVLRFFNSNAATVLAKSLVDCSDPMSGFIGFDRRRVPVDALRPIGYKIGLELMVRGDFDGIDEIPIGFRDRRHGESKMTLRQQLNYLRHLRRLYLARFGGIAEFLHFGAVGASGFIVDLSCYLLLQFAGVPHAIARGLSFWPAVSWNWFMNRMTTFGDRERRPKGRQWIEFVMTSGIGFTFSYGTYLGLTTGVAFFEQYKLLAFVAGVGTASIFNFIASSLFVYSEKRT